LVHRQGPIRVLTLVVAGVEALICLILIYQGYAPSDGAGRGLANAISGLAVSAGLIFVFPAIVLSLNRKAPITALGLVSAPLILLVVVVLIHR
jgi:hypothetical protein